MRVLLILLLACFVLLEYFHQLSAHEQSALAGVASQENAAGIPQPPRQEHQGH